MVHDEFEAALWELCDDISVFPVVDREQVVRLRKWASELSNTPAVDLLSRCLANAAERERLRSEFYKEVLDSGLIAEDELHKERCPVAGMNSEVWRVQYLEDRIHRFGLLLLILHRTAARDGGADSWESENEFLPPRRQHQR